jgi:hypothetical protein
MSDTQDCPVCYRKIKPSSNFCKFCGSTLKICPECETINKEDDTYCGECGTDIRKVDVAEGYKGDNRDFNKEVLGRREPKLVMWPPVTEASYLSQAKPRARLSPYSDYLDKEPTYQPKNLNYTYNKVKILGFLGGPLPTSNVLGAVVEVFGIALALIAIGIVIFSIGMAFFEYLVFPIIAGIVGGAFLLSAPFFGIYYVSSNWLYRTFEVKRPVKTMTIVWNYSLGSLVFALLGMMLAPIFIQGGALAITLSVVGGIVYVMGLIIVPLKAYLADLVYVKAAVNNRDKESDLEKDNKKSEEK